MRKVKVIHDCVAVDDYISGIVVYIPVYLNLFQIPSKEIDIESEVKEKGDNGTLIISEWLAKEKRLMR